MEEPSAGEREGVALGNEAKLLGSDPVYKRLYAFPEMVADLLRSVLPADALDALNMDTLAKVPASYVGDDYRQRHGDAVWRVERAGRWTYILVLLEFQSSSDATMALRVLEYTAMLYRELLRAGEASPRELPPVLPIVLYNGQSPWSAARDVGELIEETGPALLAYQPAAAAAGGSAVRRPDGGTPVRLPAAGRRPAAAGRDRCGGRALRDGRGADPASPPGEFVSRR